MQDGVDVVEDVPLGDGGVVVVGAELFEGPVRDVLAAVGAVFGVGVEGENLASMRLPAGQSLKTEWLILRMVSQPEAARRPASADLSRHGR